MTHIVQPLDEVPLLDVEPPGHYELRRVVCASVSDQVGRRGILRVIAAGGMALGLTVLGWLPLARRAFAAVGTEHLDCASFSYDGLICTPAVYSPDNCGADGWFRAGCEADANGEYTCFRPVTSCDGRNAWRWRDAGTEYRCADGEVKLPGSPRWDYRICNAVLTRE